MGSRDGSGREKDGEGLGGALRVTTGWGNPASPNIYSGFYKPPLMSREAASAAEKAQAARRLGSCWWHSCGHIVD